MWHLTALIAAIPVLLTVAACAATGSAPGPVASPTSAYQRDIGAMTKYCTETPVQLDAMVAKVHQLEVVDGINDETMTQLAGHLLTTVSAYTSRVSCADPFGAYVTLREGSG